ncbi:unnamed protein product [Auanema sp. JU1783]|nr:unnamed protein product [Auanema sp. JU1783]
MSGIVRRLRRTNKKAAKYRFTAALQELRLAVDDESHAPETVLVSFMHRRRKITSRERQWEASLSKPEQSVIIWPEQAPEHVDILTTLYKSASEDAFDDKEWTIVVEEINKKGKRRPIAAVSLNIRLFVMESPDQRTQLKLKLRPLCVHLTYCSLEIVLSSNLVKEGFRDDISRASSVSQTERNSREISVSDGCNEQKDTALLSAGQQIAAVTESIKHWSDNTVDVLPPVEEHITHPSEISKERPPWRIPNGAAKEVTVQEPAKVSTQVVFKVNEKSQPVFVPEKEKTALVPEPLAPPRNRSHSPRAPSRERKLEKVEGESLQAWAKRIAAGYYNVKLNDSAKCWQNGLALCAIIHAYRPDLIDYDRLDFSDSLPCRKNNVKKALAAAQLIGLNDIPDESYILTPDKKIINALLDRMRRTFEGIGELSAPTTAVSDHRISQLFPVSESEMKVIDEIRRMKERREANEDEMVDKVMNQKEAEDSQSADENAETDGKLEQDLPTFSLSTPRLSSIRTSGRSISPSKQEQLRLKAKQMLENPMQSVTETTNPDNDKRREEARRLIQTAVSTPVTASMRSNLTRSGSTRSRTSLGGSATDLRKIELVRPSVTIQSFKKRDPSPVLQRKQYEFDSPIIPAMGRPTQMLSDRIKQSVGAGETAFDRVKRYGSMRGQELRDSISTIAKSYGIQDPLRGSQQSLNEHATPTKKIDKLQWERDVEDQEGCQRKQEDITSRLADITQQADAIQNKIRETEKGSLEEEMLLETYLRLTEEKNSLVGQQEYFNIIENIRQVTKDIEKLNSELVEITKNTADDEDYYKPIDEKERTDRVMKSYLEAIDRKEDLMKMLFATEVQLREDEERYNSLTLERVSNFIRGSEGPLTASKRIMTWLRG